MTGQQKCIDVDDERKLRIFYDRRMAQEVEGDELGDEFKGYIFRISGGNDKQGFPMKQGVLANHRVRLLLSKGNSCYRQRRTGERKRKSVRGCIVGSDLAVLNLVIVKKGPEDIPDLTDNQVPRRLGPKRANNIRKLFNLSKEDDVRKFVIRRKFKTKTGKDADKAPKIQRLITPQRLNHKRRLAVLKKRNYESQKAQLAEYQQLYQRRMQEAKDARRSAISKRRSSRRSSRRAAPDAKAES